MSYPENPGPLELSDILNLRNRDDGGNGPLGKKGSVWSAQNEGSLVEHVQYMLRDLMEYDLGNTGPAHDGVDGKFGKKTEEAVKKFQGSHKDWKDGQLKADGLVGPKTADALNRAMVGRWYDYYQTYVELTEEYALLTTISEALKSPIPVQIEDEKKARIVLTTPLPKPKQVIECETWDGWKAINARYLILLENGEVRGLHEEDGYVTDAKGRLRPEHIPSEEFTLYVCPPEKVDVKFKRDDFKYIYTRSGTKTEPVGEKPDLEIRLFPYGEGTVIPQADERRRRYRIISDLGLVILTPALGYPVIADNGCIDVVALVPGKLAKMWSEGSATEIKLIKEFFLSCLRYQNRDAWEKSWNAESMRSEDNLLRFDDIDSGSTGRISESDLLSRLSPEIMRAYAPWKLDTIFRVRFKMAESGTNGFNLINLQGEDTALHVILSDRDYHKSRVNGQEKFLDEIYPFIEGKNNILNKLPIEIKYYDEKTKDWKNCEDLNKTAGYQTPVKNKPVRIFHPFYQFAEARDRLNIAHVTDIHISTRWELFERKLGASKFNNYNKRFSEILSQINGDSESDIVILTGDLIDYNRGHDGTDNDDFKKNYLFNRNWLFFYEKLIENYKKPVFTVLGNHEYLPNPYPTLVEIDAGAEWWAIVAASLIPIMPLFMGVLLGFFKIGERQSFGSDMNLTMDELMGLCREGSDERRRIYLELITEARPLEKAREEMDESFIDGLLRKKMKEEIEGLYGMWYTSKDSVTWYHLVINPFQDYCLNYKDMSIMLLDWNEKVVTGSLILLPRPPDCPSAEQMGLIEKWIQNTGVNLRILCTHSPILHATPKVGDRWLRDGLLKDEHDLKMERVDDYKYNDKVETALQPKPKLMDAPVPVRKMIYGVISDETRNKLLEILNPAEGSYPINIVLSGHTHTNRVFQVEKDEVNHIDKVHLRNVIEQENPIGPGHPPLLVVTTSGGPIGWFDEAAEWQELVPPGYRLVRFGTGVRFENKDSKSGFEIPGEIRNEANTELDWDGVTLKPARILIHGEAPGKEMAFDDNSALIGKLNSDLVITEVEDHGDIVQWMKEVKKTVVIKEVGENKTLTIRDNDGTIVVLDNRGTITVEDNDDILSIDRNWPSGRIEIKQNDDDIYVRKNEGIIMAHNERASVSFEQTDRPELEVLVNSGDIFIEANSGGTVTRSIVYIELNEKNIIVNGNDDQVTVNMNKGTVTVNNNYDRVSVNENQKNMIVNWNDDTIEVKSNTGSIKCGRIDPPCPGHGSPKDRCTTGKVWRCGAPKCPTHGGWKDKCK